VGERPAGQEGPDLALDEKAGALAREEGLEPLRHDADGCCGSRRQIDTTCLEGRRREPYSHDHCSTPFWVSSASNP
jgi:hypothetical protein